MIFRLVSTPGKGAKPKGLVICFLVGSGADAALRKALPSYTVVATAERSLAPTSTDLANARRVGKVSAEVPVFLGAWSAGCQTVRQILLGNMIPAEHLLGVGVFDGTHGSIPPAQWQVDVWAKELHAALKGERRFAATCTEMDYVERIRPGEIGRATSTKHILEAAIGRELVPGQPLKDAAGRVFVACYPSDKEATKAAAAAHIHQVQVVLPQVLGALLEGREVQAPEPQEESQDLTEDPPGEGPSTVQEATAEEMARGLGQHGGDWRDPSVPFGVRSVLWCLEELAAGVKETPPGSNDDGPDGRIRQYSTGIKYTRKDLKTGKEKGIGTLKDDWCAKAMSFSHFAVAQEGEAYPPHRIAGIEIQTDATERDAFLRVEDVRAGKVTPQIGAVAVYKRGKEAWQRHVCKVRSWRSDGKFQTIGGNESSGWQKTDRTIWDTDLLGFVEVSPDRWG